MSNERDFDIDWHRFPALMAHDLKGPLGNLVLYTNLALDEVSSLEGVDPVSAELLTKVISQLQESSEKLIFQVQCWVDSHLLIRGTYQKKDDLFDIQQVIEQAAEAVRVEFSQRNLKLTVKKSESSKIHSDPLLLKNALKNLLFTVALFASSGDTVQISAIVNNKEAVFDIDYPASQGMDRVISRLMIDFNKTRQVDTTEGLIKTGVFGMIYTNLAIKSLKGSVHLRDSGHRSAFGVVVPTGV